MNKKLAFFITDGFQPLDLFGPLDTFEEANSLGSQLYHCQIFSFTKGLIKSATGHHVMADYAVEDISNIDYLIICGGSGMRTLQMTPTQKQQLRMLADSADKVMSICTGAFVLAQIHEEQPLTLTTHWQHCHELKNAYRNMNVQPDPLFMQDNRIWSSAGVLSGVDLALAIIRLDLGNTFSATIARQLVVYMQRKGSQNQFSDLLNVQSSDSLRLTPLIEWLSENLSRSITVLEMADFINVSERQLSRLFKQHLSYAPAQYLTQLRLTRARDLISEDNRTLQQIARQVGFASYDSFRRAFERQFGLSPSLYQA